MWLGLAYMASRHGAQAFIYHIGSSRKQERGFLCSQGFTSHSLSLVPGFVFLALFHLFKSPVSPTPCHHCGIMRGFFLLPPSSSSRAAPHLNFPVTAGASSLEIGWKLEPSAVPIVLQELCRAPHHSGTRFSQLAR